MIKPDFETYKSNANNSSSVPIYIQFYEDFFTPIALFEKLKPLNPVYLLESAGEHQENGRYSYIGIKGENISNQFENITELEDHLKQQTALITESLPPFYNGYIGYMGYEAIKNVHPIKIKKQSRIPTFQVIYSKMTVIIDHFINQVTIVYNTDTKSDEYEIGKNMIKTAYALIQSTNVESKVQRKLKKSLHIKSNMDKPYYKDMIQKAKSYIENGDIFQVVLSQKFTAPLEVPAFEIYKSVRRENPSPYLSYIKFDHLTTICSSPELLLKHADGLLATAPIAGTRAVKHDGRDDARARELINDQKELSEHLMLVDLGRNDIGKVSKPGTVKVESFCQIKKYAKVMHLVSSVTGQLKENESSFTALISAYPAGTVSGAPKIRAMEIIDELEPDERDLYAGTIFYINHNGNLNSCIAIRTMTIQNDEITIQSGGGIVYDSNPEDEYKETINKASALFKALSYFYEGGISYDFNN